MRFQNRTLDGALLSEHEERQQAADKACAVLSAGVRVYTCDTEGGPWPYTAWRLGQGGPVAYIGTPCKDFAEVMKEVQKQT